MRGNHEDLPVCSTYGFKSECERRFPGSHLFERFAKLFEYFPIACVVDKKVFCVHGGLSQTMKLGTLRKVKLPIDLAAADNMGVWDMLWNDPDEKTDSWGPNTSRGMGCYFSKGVAEQFLEENHMELIIRAHQVAYNGWNLQFDKTMLTIFSCSNYGGVIGNRAAMLQLQDTKDLTTINEDSFQFISPFNYSPR